MKIKRACEICGKRAKTQFSKKENRCGKHKMDSTRDSIFIRGLSNNRDN